LRLTPRTHKLELKNYAFFERIVKQSFAQRRKTLHNNLKEIFKELNTDMTDFPINTKLRAENLSVKDFVTLANYLS
jgi:16S rRNA (adenine1518-N6/adenine1519-N6)-dimethyltransferase